MHGQSSPRACCRSRSAIPRRGIFPVDEIARRSAPTVLRAGARARAPVLRRPGLARARRADRRALGGSRRPRGPARHRDHQRRQPGPLADDAGAARARRRRRLRGPELHVGPAGDPRARHAPDARRPGRSTTASTSTPSRRLLARNEIKALAIQPRLHNPTGRDLSPERRERLLELARRHGFFIVEDGIYGDLRFERRGPGLAARRGARRTSIYVDSFSKTLGGGLRAGWVAASGPVLDRIVAEKRAARHPLADPHPARDRPATSLAGAYAGAGRARPPPLPRAGCDALLESIDAALRRRRPSYAEPLGGGHVWLTLDLPLEEARPGRRGDGEAASPACPARRCRSSAVATSRLRLSYGYLEPAELDEGVRRLAAAARTVGARGRAAPRGRAGLAARRSAAPRGA